MCCALEHTVRACPFQFPFKCVYACQMDSLSTRGWVLYVPLCLAAQHCSGWRDSHALSHTADFTRSHALSCLRLQPSFCRSPVTPPPDPPFYLHSLVSSHSFFHSPECLHPLLCLLLFTDTWANWFAVWMAQQSQSRYPAEWPWSM